MKQRLVIAASLAAVAVLVAVAVIVFQFGRIDPSPASLRDSPNDAIPGEILYTSDQACLTRAAASGETRREICHASLLYIGPFAWIASNTIRTWSQSVIADIDLESGVRTPITPSSTGFEKYPQRPPVSPSGETVITDRGDIYIVGSGGNTKIASFDLGDSWMEPILWSPDGQWILLRWQPPRDADSELWIISRDGSVKGTLAKDFQGNWAAWRIEGVGATPAPEELFTDTAPR